MTLTGVLLAGGEAQRFGSDKLEVNVEGRTMLAHVVEALRGVADRFVVSVRDPEAAGRLRDALPFEVTWLVDRPELGGKGPGAGMLTALDQLGPGEVLFSPGDMPWLSAEGLRELRRRAGTAKATAAAPIWPDGWTEPLVQWQRTEDWSGRLAKLPRREGHGVRPTDLLRGGSSVLLVPVSLLSADPRCFANVNRPEDLRAPLRPRGGGARSEPVARSAEAGAAFWEAVAFSRKGAAAEASRSFEEEASLHAESNVAHLELHALEDAVRWARQAGLSTTPLEERRASARRALGA